MCRLPQLLAIFILLAKLCEGSTDMATKDNCEVKNKECFSSLERVKRALIKFTFQLLYQLLISGISEPMTGPTAAIFALLFELALYAKGNTLAELLKFLGCKNRNEIRKAFQYFADTTENPPEGVNFLFANDIVFDNNNQFTKPINLEIAGGLGLGYNFCRPKEVTRKVNQVIANQTNNKVQNAITTSEIFKKDCTTSNLVFAIGVYFEALWQKAFDGNNLTIRGFCDLQNNIHQVPFLYQHAIFNYTESSILDAQVISIPFKDGFYNNIIIVSNKKCSSNIAEMLQTLQDPDVLQDILRSFRPAAIKYYIPLFSNNTSEYDVVKILKQIGELNCLLDKEASQIENAFGRNIDGYLYSGRQKFILKDLLAGVEPPNGKLQNTGNLKEYTVIADRPVISLIENYGVIRVCAIGNIKLGTPAADKKK